MQLYRLVHRDGTDVVLCQEHLDEVYLAERETLGKVEDVDANDVDGCFMCQSIQNKESL